MVSRKRKPRIPLGTLGEAESLAQEYSQHVKRVTGQEAKINRVRLLDFVRIFLLADVFGVHPSAYVFGSFEFLRWSSIPSFKVLTSPQSVGTFQNNQFWLQPAWADSVEIVSEPVDPNLDILPIRESLKRMIENRDDCRRSLLDTGGFHPDSILCQACELADGCAQELNEIVGLPLSQARGIEREEAIRRLKGMFPGYPRTILLERAVSAAI
jgi:hypothetical protein